MNTELGPVRVWRQNQQRREFLGEVGVLLEWSVQYMQKTIIGIIEVKGRKIMGQLCGIEVSAGLTKNMRVVGRMRRMNKPSNDGVIEYGVKWEPI